MEAGFIAILIVTDALAVIIGFVIGICYHKSINKYSKTHGNIYVDFGDSKNDPSLFLESHVPLEEFASENRAVFEVRVLSNDSRK